MSKIVKIIINKFGEYNGEINLNDCTLINCAYLNPKGNAQKLINKIFEAYLCLNSIEISKLTNVLKFMFSNEDCSDLEELQHVDKSDDTDW